MIKINFNLLQSLTMDKVNDLVTLHKAMHEKLKTASYSEQIQILTFVPDKWSRIYCSEYFNVFETLFELRMKSKKQVVYQQNRLQKKGKTITTETLYLLPNAYKNYNFSRQVPEKKDYVSVSRGVHKQKLCNLQKFWNLQELYTAFKEKHLNVNIGFSKFCALRPKWRVLDGSKMTHSVCICSAHQNVVLLINVMDLDVTYKDLIKLTLSSLKYFHQNLFSITFISPSFTRVFFL